MGMDYVPVYEGEDSAPASGGELRIAVDRVQKLGVRAEPAAIRNLQSTVKASGRVEIDERRVTGVTPRFEGYVETLHVNATGQPVAKGQPLFEMYSPELVSVQREYAIAMQAVKNLAAAGPAAQAPMQRLADASLARLRAFDVSDEQIRAISEGGAARRTLTFRAPVGGVILEKKAVQGMRFVKRVLRAPGKLHIVGRNGFFVWIEARFGGDEGECFLTCPLLDGRHVLAAGEEQILVQIGVTEVDAVKLTVEFSQVFSKRKIPERPVIEPFVAWFKLAAGGQRTQTQQHQSPYHFTVNFQ
jgi:hypothetical protein